MTGSVPAEPGIALGWPARRIVVAVVSGAVLALAIGVPTGVIPTSLYTRMTPVLWWNYPVWAATAVLGGLLVATYIRRPGEVTARSGLGSASGGGLLAAFAVGCPICNKLVVATLGISGALTVWAPLQPALGGLSVLGLSWALRRRIKNEYACSLAGPPASPADARSNSSSPEAERWPLSACSEAKRVTLSEPTSSPPLPVAERRENGRTSTG